MSNLFSSILPALTSDMSTGGVVAAALPALRTSMITISPISSLTVAAKLPGLTSQAIHFGGLEVRAVLPAMVGGTITGTVDVPLRVHATLPALHAGTISATLTGFLSVRATLPLPRVDLARGVVFPAQALPSLQLVATIVPNATFASQGALPALRSGTILITNAQTVLSVAALLPALTAGAGSAHVAATLPALRGAMTVVSGTLAVRQGWALNCTHFAVTEVTNFPFRQFARAFDRYYGVGLDGGLYLMRGDNDAGTPIDWAWRTGLSDVGSRAGKGVLGVYVDGVVEPGVDFSVTTDLGTYFYVHRPHGRKNTHQTQRVITGKKLRSVNWAFGMQSAKGAYFELDSVTPEWQISNRNVY